MKKIMLSAGIVAVLMFYGFLFPQQNDNQNDEPNHYWQKHCKEMMETCRQMMNETSMMDKEMRRSQGMMGHGMMNGMRMHERKQSETNPYHSYDTITVEEVRTLIEKEEDVLFLDVRTPEEFHGELGHLPNARPLPIQVLHERYDELENYKENHIVIYCRTDNRSRRAATFLVEEKGYENVSVMIGGMVEWNEQFGKPEH